MDSKPILRAEDLSVGYKGKALVTGLNFSLYRGSLVALVGRNGVGKSTLLRTITTELPPVKGEIFLDGTPLKEWSRRRLASEIAVVTTEHLQVGALTVRELVNLGRDPHTGRLGRMTAEDRRAVQEAMDAVGIAYKADEYVACLSDGERQKALIARALAQDTPLIVLDEPFSFLDVSARVEILGLLRRLCHEHNRALLYSSHDIAQALRMADLIWMLTPERKFVEGSPETLIREGTINLLFNNPGVRFDASQNDFVST